MIILYYIIKSEINQKMIKIPSKPIGDHKITTYFRQQLQQHRQLPVVLSCISGGDYNY